MNRMKQAALVLVIVMALILALAPVEASAEHRIGPFTVVTFVPGVVLGFSVGAITWVVTLGNERVAETVGAVAAFPLWIGVGLDHVLELGVDQRYGSSSSSYGSSAAATHAGRGDNAQTP